MSAAAQAARDTTALPLRFQRMLAGFVEAAAVLVAAGTGFLFIGVWRVYVPPTHRLNRQASLHTLAFGCRRSAASSPSAEVATCGRLLVN